MLKKTIKVRGVEERTAFVEFLIDKRVKFLEYLQNLHSDDGALWMNSVYFNRAELGKYFGIPAECLDVSDGEKTGDGQSPTMPSISLSPSRLRPAQGGVMLPVHLSPFEARGDQTGAENAANPEETFTTVSLAQLPSSVHKSVSPDWVKQNVPCFCALAMSLSDLLLMPVSSEELVECIYMLFLEVEVAFAGGPATKALAQRNLKQARQHASPSLYAAVNALPATDAAKSSIDVDLKAKYLFLTLDYVTYLAAPPSYDAVFPSLCSVLILTYRKMCDLDLMEKEAAVSRILSIDKRVERIVLAPVSKEIERAARAQLISEAFLLSAGGLFAEIGGGHAEAGVSFINDILQSQSAALEKEREESVHADDGELASSSDAGDSDMTDDGKSEIKL